MFRRICITAASAGLLIALSAADTVATSVYSRVGNGYKREQWKDGSYKPEYYALANGGRIAGTTSDVTVDRITYPEVAEISMRLLAQQNYRYAQSKEQANLLLTLQWGSTIAPNGTNYEQGVGYAGQVLSELRGLSNAGGTVIKPLVDPLTAGESGDAGYLKAQFEMAMLRLFTENQARDRINEHNARILGYMDDLADTNDIRRWAGGGDRYTDLITDVEESRYFIVISAYDFRELTDHNKKKLLWQTRVSVRSPGNRFDHSFGPMLKGASKYFGQDSGRLIKGEESKGSVELGDLKFIGEAKVPAPTKTGGSKK
ncbi:MAG: hypothetical protein QG602_1678 [Verrucomicrobiota bacterium]|nr:hypothetical protein [Verrucomicrobiota bacterium]